MRVVHLADQRCLKAAFRVWAFKLKEKKRTDWQHMMRTKMKLIQDRREGKLRKDAWAKWRQSYQSHLSRQHYAERLILRFYRRWEDSLAKLDHMEAVADEHQYVIEERTVERCWDCWRKAMQMKMMEKTMSERVGLRIMGKVIDIWKQHL
jgi:protein SFI1